MTSGIELCAGERASRVPQRPQASAAAAKRELAEPYAAAELALAPPTIGVEGVCHLPRAAGLHARRALERRDGNMRGVQAFVSSPHLG